MIDAGEALRGRLKELEDTGYPAYNEACYDLAAEFIILPPSRKWTRILAGNISSELSVARDKAVL